ncbi:hypothetical protein [Bacillus sp. NEB1478]|uniref:hypothetical protein n=1 Tax=Bacillus sp. NEB1478 TaxID=3073816 RepID=UPI002872FC58|nr:hypothetical protein [Bacillus sp. NEB1478]WNB92635.1 hypothetical protein RGB74_02905 [Bacillus sp. NEB1478]
MIAFIGLMGFLVFLIMGVVSLFKKNGNAKRSFIISFVAFVLFIVGVVNSDSDTASKTTADEKNTYQEEKKEKKAANKSKEKSTVAEVKEVISKGITDKNFKKEKKKLNVDQPNSISIGNGNVGYVLEAKDGIIVASTDGVKIIEVVQFSNMDEVSNYEKQMLAKAEAADKEQAIKEREESKQTATGKGDTATDAIPLKAGWAIFDGSHTGGSNFAVQLQDENGNDMELLVNEIGNYKGKTFAQIPNDGDYFLNVTADGTWNFNIYQTPPVDIPDAPTTLTGSGDDVVFFNTSSGNHKFTFTHQGESNFAVLLNGEDLLVNEIGNYNGSMRNQLGTDGAYAFVITADGKWTAKIEK